jgi:tetratricopeptide (TPR) repeat protein
MLFRRLIPTGGSIGLAALLMSVMLTAVVAVRPQEEPSDTTSQAIALFDQGQDEHAKRNFGQAIEFYDKALKILPEFAEAEFQKGNAYLSLGKKAEAEAALRRAVGIRGDWTLALAALGTALERRGEYKEAEQLLTKAISIDASSIPAYSGLIEMRLKTGADAGVLKVLLEKVRSFSAGANPTPAMFVAQASLEKALNDNTSAAKTIARALAADPNNTSALFIKADLAVARGDLVLAEEVTRSLEKLEPSSESTKLLRARILIASEKPAEASKLLASIESPSPETMQLVQTLAIANEQSPEILEKALTAQPANTLILGKLCSAYRISAPERSLDYCRRALEAEPSNINFAIGYGAALVQAKRYDEAVALLRRLSSLAPDIATIHANLGTALFQSRRYAEAKTEYQWLTAHEPVPPIAYYFLAICHDELGELLDAGANYNLFLKNADATRNQLEIDKVNLRLPILQREIKQGGGRSKNKSGL